MLYSTQIKTSRDLRNNFAEIQRLLQEHDQVVITNNGKGSAVVINFEDYAGYEEYLREKQIFEDLQAIKKELDDPNAKMYTVSEVRQRMSERINEIRRQANSAE